MRALDTNVLARLVLRDDEPQLNRAIELVREPFWVPVTVWLELGWVLSKRLDRTTLADVLAGLLEFRTLHTLDPSGIAWAVEQYRSGADWADMLHLVSLRGVAQPFATFDRALARHAGAAAPVTIDTLA